MGRLFPRPAADGQLPVRMPKFYPFVFSRLEATLCFQLDSGHSWDESSRGRSSAAHGLNNVVSVSLSVFRKRQKGGTQTFRHSEASNSLGNREPVRPSREAPGP